MDVLGSTRARRPRPRGARARDRRSGADLDRDERIAISGVPSARTVACLAEQCVNHVVNCRPQAQARRSEIWRRAGGSRTRRCMITACGSGPRCGRRHASPRGYWTIGRRRECSSTAPRQAPLGHAARMTLASALPAVRPRSHRRRGVQSRNASLIAAVITVDRPGPRPRNCLIAPCRLCAPSAIGLQGSRIHRSASSDLAITRRGPGGLTMLASVERGV